MTNKKRESWVVLAIVLICYVTAVSCFSFHHEIWRDEAGPINLVFQSYSWSELVASLHNYGHPGLWHTLLYLFKGLYPSYEILKILNLLISILAAYVLLVKSPFLLWQRALLLSGYFLLYYFPVVNRNYGLAWFLFLLFCVLYSYRWSRTVLLSLVLLLLANTHALGLVITIAVLIALFVELLLDSKERCNLIKKKFVGLVVVIGGVSLSVMQIVPDTRSDLFQWSSVNLFYVVQVSLQSIFLPGFSFSNLLGGSHPLAVTVFIWCCYYVLFFVDRVAFIVLFLGITGVSTFLMIFYPSYSSYHQSFVYMLLIFSFWVLSAKKNLFRWQVLLFHGLFLILLVSQILLAFPAIKKDLLEPFSSSKSFSEWIKSWPQGQEYVLIGEPDYLLYSLPYYVDNPIYIPRENRFGRMTKNSIDNKMVFSLKEFLNAGRKLQIQGKKVFLVLGHKLSSEGPFDVTLYSDKRFTYSPEDLTLWQNDTKIVAVFQRAFYGQENYDVYVLK